MFWRNRSIEQIGFAMVIFFTPHQQTGWWFFTKPSEKDANVKMGSSAPNTGEHTKMFETTT